MILWSQWVQWVIGMLIYLLLIAARVMLFVITAHIISSFVTKPEEVSADIMFHILFLVVIERAVSSFERELSNLTTEEVTDAEDPILCDQSPQAVE